MGLFRLFKKDEVVGSRVLVCSLGNHFEESLKSDSHSYGRYYRDITVGSFSRIQQLSEAINRRYDIVHLLCDVSGEGEIRDAESNSLVADDLVEKCVRTNVKLLWLASDNGGKAYMDNFHLKGKPLNVVMTIDRKGSSFPEFLEKLLFRMFYGDTVPVAWVDLAPQIPGLNHPNLPGDDLRCRAWWSQAAIAIQTNCFVPTDVRSTAAVM